METLLLIIAVVLMLFVVGLCVAVWRSMQGARDDAAARVETLRHLAFAEDATSMFASAGERGAAKRRGMAVAVVATVMMSIAGAAFAVHDAEPAQSVRPAARSFELLALRHTTGERGEFLVIGEVRNAPDGGSLTGLAAEVELLDVQGRRVANLQAALPVDVLHAGEASRFTVAFPRMRGVAQYRVQFRQGGSLVRHIDRRAASAGPGNERTGS